MPTRSFLNKQVGVSEQHGRTLPPLRSIILGSVRQALREHYGDNYANRCMQSASAIVLLLQHCGIDSLLVQGEACFGQVVGKRLAWTQFGGQPERFHFWSITKFGELIDLTVHQNHLAPGVPPGGAPCPALWWDDAARMPGAFRYLPASRRGRIAVELADAGEQERFGAFMARAEQAFDQNLASGYQPPLPEVVASIEDLNRMRQNGDPWASVAWKFQDLQLPAWAQKRWTELMAHYVRFEGE